MKYSVQPGLGEVSRAEPDLVLEEATAKAVKAMNLLALQSVIEGLAAPQAEVGSLKPADYGELAGVLSCRVCLRPIRDHEVTEFHTQA